MTQNNPSKEVKARKPKGSINWLKLGKDKEPEFGQTVLLYDSTKGNDIDKATDIGWLKGKELEKSGSVYKFYIGYEDGKDIIEIRFTHYAIITPPVE